jgi:hypothetical protein
MILRLTAEDENEAASSAFDAPTAASIGSAQVLDWSQLQSMAFLRAKPALKCHGSKVTAGGGDSSSGEDRRSHKNGRPVKPGQAEGTEELKDVRGAVQGREGFREKVRNAGLARQGRARRSLFEQYWA